ncbi:MAG: L-histidine N(alpha)-methyltransferase, partial [Flavobacteriales bacterium]|nr:L-histidine N(alpha)-methyltransferase [Flavobacteriales bacterium]
AACELDNPGFDIFELGAGNGRKTVELLKCLNPSHFTFKPIDISPNALDGLQGMLDQVLPELKVDPLVGEYFDVLRKIDSNRRKIVLFLGSNIGNLNDEDAHRFIKELAATLNSGDYLLLGVDLIKPASIVLPAYDDKTGYTKAFNLNLLTRINNELGGDFVLDQFEHTPKYSENDGYARSFLTSNAEQVVYLADVDRTIKFEKDERILMEISRKYNDEILSKIILDTGFKIKCKLMDSKEYFADYVLQMT